MCEYEMEATRHKITGTLCTLTGRACFIENDQGKPRCQRRLWANQYLTKQTSSDSSRSPVRGLGGTGIPES
jgi:hypothetical protein